MFVILFRRREMHKNQIVTRNEEFKELKTIQKEDRNNGRKE
jgi:hypothetical protein